METKEDGKSIKYGRDIIDDAISIAPLINILRVYKNIILLVSVAGFILLSALFLHKYFNSAKDFFASISFVLNFNGSEKGEYPNGTKFNTSDITSSYILADVYKLNKLKDYLSFEDFQNSISIKRNNPAMELAAAQYEATIENRNIPLPEKDRIIKEYLEKAKDNTSYVYTLNFDMRNSPKIIPDYLISKILNNILEKWSKISIKEKGISTYPIDLMTTNVFDKTQFLSYDNLIAIDIIRYRINLIEGMINNMLKIPGISVERIGPENISLNELKEQIRTVTNYKVNPIKYYIMRNNLSANDNVFNYMQGILKDYKSMIDVSTYKLKVYDDALNAYNKSKNQTQVALPKDDTASRALPNDRYQQDKYQPTIMPQFGDAFFEKIANASALKEDIAFKQKIVLRSMDEGLKMAELVEQEKNYRELIDNLEKFRQNEKVAGVDIKLTNDNVKAQIGEIVDYLTIKIKQVEALYNKVSYLNMVIEPTLYNVTYDVTTINNHNINLRLMMAKYTIFLFVIVFLATIICLIHYYLKKNRLK
ncbi:MAG: hypothetical protein HQK89_11650 [Nitrospirae bacterium]|nr:hypothetical protein [Nitrospirota bacterium]